MDELLVMVCCSYCLIFYIMFYTFNATLRWRKKYNIHDISVFVIVKMFTYTHTRARAQASSYTFFENQQLKTLSK